ncbi:MAG: hypothetical protein KatS3mg059_1143 [Thermomicrobiales bacterium]|nr:MAG: hypothetical protein KatS3mg059_1143 [Thermomicrobiales bacterium]
MQPETFDSLARVVGAAGGQPVSRRSFLRAAAAGIASAGLTRSLSLAQEPAATPATGATEPSHLPSGPTIEQLAFDLEYDIERCFRFVASNVHYHAYAGALRGPKGVLWSLAGNSVDQAQLLAALLNEGMVRTRFAIGELDDAAVAALTAAMTTDEAALRRQAALRSAWIRTGSAEALATDPPPSPPLATDAQSLIAEAQRQLRSTQDMIVDNLAVAGITLAPVTPPLPELEHSQHVWVQYAAGGTWVDLDPSIPNAEPGKTYARLIQTVDALPEELFHTVSFRAVLETVQGGQPVRQDALSYQARAQDLVGVPLTLMHVTPESLHAIGFGITGTLEGTIQYLPRLIIGNDQVIRETNRVTFGIAGEGIGAAFGDASGSEGETLAEWLIVDIQSPDGAPLTEERTIFDRVPQEARLAQQIDVSAIPPVEMTDVPERGRTYLPMLALTNIAVVGAPIAFEILQFDTTGDDVISNLTSISHTYHFTRDRTAVETASEHGWQFYPDRPNVTLFFYTPVDVTSETGRLSVDLDIVSQSLAAVPLSGQTPAAPAPLIAGILSHTAERLLMETAPMLVPDAPFASRINTGRLFDEAVRAGIPLITLSPANPDLSSLQASAIAKFRMSAALSRGQVILVPQTPITLDGMSLTGWWEIEPVTGAARDRLETGRGHAFLRLPLRVELTEQSFLYWLAVELYHAKKLALCGVAILAVAYSVGALLAGAVAQGGIAIAAAGAGSCLVLGLA